MPAITRASRTGPVEVREVTTRSERRAFLRLPWGIYRGDPNWVPPLLSGVARTLDPRRNPFYEHAESRLYLAWRGRRPVGRVAATVDRLYNEYHNDTMGFWGFFECENDPEAAKALLDGATDDLRSRGMTQMMGPMNPSINNECGLLVEGFRMPPVFLMPYNPPYYPDLILQAGLQQAKDLLAYLLLPEHILGGDNTLLERIARLSGLIHRRHPGLRIRTLDTVSYEADVLAIGTLFNTVRKGNWGFVPVTEAELRDMAREMKAILDPQMVFIAELDGRPVGCLLALPDINPILRKCNGRLLPFGWLRMLLGRRSLRQVRVFGSAALEEYRHIGIVPLLFGEVIRIAQQRGYASAELSWVAEGNLPPILTIENVLKPELYKRYRVYSRSL
ncbi:MAG TPA: N-acetyltransferase [Planctomycetota bacterium]|nr:N-acetyltransferase [Planctomycetota bacterium]